MKKLYSILFSTLLLLGIFVLPTYAQSPTPLPTSSPQNSRINSDVENNLSTYTQSVIIELMSAISCQLTGIDPINPQQKCLGIDPATGKIGYVHEGNGGLVGLLGEGIAFTYNIPVRSSDYVAYTASNFGIAKSTYAQTDQDGIGYFGLQPILKIWEAFRNLVYLLFVIVFMLIGLGIVFRRSIDARTVMTVQSMIPRAIVVLLLITFSFAISGFLIDVMYILMFVIFEVFVNAGISVVGLNPLELQNNTPFQAVGGFFGYGDASPGIVGIAKDSSWAIKDVITDLIGGNSLLPALITGIVGSILGSSLSIPFGGLAGGIIGGAAGFFIGDQLIGTIGGLIAFFIIAIALVAALLRLWFLLVKSYIFILMDVVLAPLWIAGSLIPGSPVTAGTWFRHIFGYVLVFPLAFTMLLLGSAFVQEFSSADPGYFAPPLVGNPLRPGIFGAIIGMMTIMMTPEVVNIVKDILKSPTNKYQQSIMKGLGTGVAAYSKVGSPIKSRLWATDPKTGAKTGSINRWLYHRKQHREQHEALEGRANPNRYTRATRKLSQWWNNPRVDAQNQERFETDRRRVNLLRQMNQEIVQNNPGNPTPPVLNVNSPQFQQEFAAHEEVRTTGQEGDANALNEARLRLRREHLEREFRRVNPAGVLPNFTAQAEAELRAEGRWS